jgi:anti-sigma B factor antagonist
MIDKPLELQIDSNANRTLIKLSGPLLLCNLFGFQTAFRTNTAPVLIVDLTGVPYLDSAGLGALVGAKISADRKGQFLALVGINERVSSSLQLIRVHDLFNICGSVAEAERTAA